MTHYHLCCLRCDAIKYVGSNATINESGHEEVNSYDYICKKCSDKEAKKNDPLVPS